MNQVTTLPLMLTKCAPGSTELVRAGLMGSGMGSLGLPRLSESTTKMSTSLRVQ